ncbi:RNB-domain-containing protein [Cryphonectria parasitica EP155]|uniref:RNB-domain-containing protein n=1 Tax=Cryphonectria parasitica (strain ATCC 38755 / EP155) TaxID=660469 RepID=A0A9P4Y9P2_CRYP1|nr:RNB-domain-containing protein [Cryphonectria parasitica EP155]KAF3769073.1 RNB-domain-containing protein [Cryphonectria parasitica EP155]
MQRAKTGSYVCWKCLSRGVQPKPSSVKRLYSTTSSRLLRAQGAHDAFRDNRTNFAIVQEQSLQPQFSNDTPRIRDRLRQWEAENQVDAPEPMLIDAGEAGQPQNLLTRPRHANQIGQINEEWRPGLEQPFQDSDGALESLPGPTDFQPGDLIEHLGDSERVPHLAIYLGYRNDLYHFYTITGEWKVIAKLSSQFVIRKFVSKDMLQPVLDKLPGEHLSREAVRARMQMNQDQGPDRITGSELLRKLAKFQQKTDEALHKFGIQLERAHEIVSEAGDRYVTLDQIQSRLSKHIKDPLWSWPTPPHVLYAVYRAVTEDDLGFRALDTLGNSQTWLFEVTPREDVALIKNIQTLVRLFTDIPGKVKTTLSDLTAAHLKQSQLGRFILKARDAIDQSRQFRDWTPHGMLGPAKQQIPRARTNWSDVDMSIMHFMLMWTGLDQFSVSSRYHWIGSAILRATGRYKDTEYLSTTVGWTFLQEVGYVTPWDLHDRYVKRLPSVKLSREGGFAPLPLGPAGIKPYITPDAFYGKRHDWEGLKAFAIDSKETTDVDDAVSVEATDVPGEHWVHVHVADPASQIRPQCALGERAQLTPLTLYLPGHYSNIWGVKDEVGKLFSLAPNRPCLTFSGRINEDGEILESKITPAKLQELIYMTPEDANAAVGFEKPPNLPEWAEKFVVGAPVAEKLPSREMTAPSELQPQDVSSLKTLYRLAEARHQKRLADGALPVFPPRPKAKVSFAHTSVEQVAPGLMTCNGDPSISISFDTNESPMITSIMQLAGEIAGRWCADRNVPVPYHQHPLAVKNFELSRSYAEKVVYPYFLRGEFPPPEALNMLYRFLGGDELSTHPGRNFLMGTEAYVKVTSPLRRYSDLIVHWQIENALLQEAEAGAIAEQKLPFLRKELEKEILPWLRMRQRVLKSLNSHWGSKGYLLQAMLRAWKYPDAAPSSSRLPDTFRLRVNTRLTSTAGGGRKLKAIIGTLDWFDIDAWLVPEALGRLGLGISDIRKGDVFEVELVDINVHQKDVFVQAVGKIKVQKDEEVAGKGEEGQEKLEEARL